MTQSLPCNAYVTSNCGYVYSPFMSWAEPALRARYFNVAISRKNGTLQWKLSQEHYDAMNIFKLKTKWIILKMFRETKGRRGRMIFSRNLVLETGKNKENLRTDSDNVRNVKESFFILCSLDYS